MMMRVLTIVLLTMVVLGVQSECCIGPFAFAFNELLRRRACPFVHVGKHATERLSIRSSLSCKRSFTHTLHTHAYVRAMLM
jgi:hypothetical protein